MSLLPLHQHQLCCRVRGVGIYRHSAKTLMGWYHLHYRRIGCQPMHKGRRRFGSHLIPAYSYRTADTLPNANFIDDPAVVSDKRLDSTQLSFLEGTSVRLTFRHKFNLEASDQNPSLGYDGGVLELSTDGGNTVFRTFSPSEAAL